MFPLKTLRKPETTPWVTYGLILINVLVFGWELTLSRAELGQQFFALAVVPCEMTRNLLSPETVLDSVRSLFLHNGWVHLVGNMVFLYMFGPNVEAYLGKAKYIFFYLAAGFAASFLHAAISWKMCVPVIGASGAIFGVMGAFVLLYPATRIRTLAFFFRVPIGTADVQAFYLLFTFFIMDLFNGIASLGVQTSQSSGVAVWAHVGGFLMGLVLAFIFMLFRPPPPVDPFEHLDAE
ncbi:MAG: rhomboid family intramembrane serine protease [Aggregatilineales bacterium]